MAEIKQKKVTIGVEGMRCSMCESHVSDLLRKVPGVKKASASLHKNEAYAICSEDVSLEALTAAISKDGYGILSAKEEPYEKKGFFARIFGK